MTNMTPIPIPDQAARANPDLKALHIGPPPGMTDEECGTVESLAGMQDDMPVYADYWRPTPEQLSDLAAGGYIELRQYAPRMIMHSMTVHAMVEKQITCPHCGRVNEAHDGPGGLKTPEAGDISLCWKCGGLGIYTEDSVRLCTPDEQAKIEASSEVKAARAAIAESFTPTQADTIRNSGDDEANR